MMSEASNSTCNTDAYAIGSTFNATAPNVTQPPYDCTPYSGSSSASIEASTISKVVDETDDAGIVIKSTDVTGVQIVYSGGLCASTGGPASFTVKTWCNASVPVLDTQYGG
jgi:hypothetical protein